MKRLASVSDPAVPVDDPLTALAALAGEVIRWKDLLAEHVAELDGLRYSGVVGEQVRGEVQLFRQALTDCNTILGTYARVGVDERLTAISERQADLIAGAIRAALAELDLSVEQAGRADGAVARAMLRLVAS